MVLWTHLFSPFWTGWKHSNIFWLFSSFFKIKTFFLVRNM
jgi:hypothetical protein